MSENIAQIRAVANALKALNKDIYFIGGAIVSLYADNLEVFEHRFTDDIDVLIEIVSRGKYFIVQEKLRDIGFTEDVESTVICRWKYQGISVDIMPLHEEILGFTNLWYEKGIQNSIEYEIGNNENINIFSFPYFLAAKFEALKNRGIDWRYSKDFEDIIKSIESRGSAVKEIRSGDPGVKKYLVKECMALLMDTGILHEAIYCITYPNTGNTRIELIIALLDEIIQTN